MPTLVDLKIENRREDTNLETCTAVIFPGLYEKLKDDLGNYHGHAIEILGKIDAKRHEIVVFEIRALPKRSNTEWGN